MGDPSDDEVEKEDAAGRPEGDQEEAGERGVARAAYFRCYRRMRIFGFKWANAEYEWLRGRLTDYNIGRTSGYTERRASFSLTPEDRADAAHLYLGETWIYEGESARHTWEMERRSVMQEEGHYMRWGVIGRIGCTWNMVSEEEYSANQHAPKNERRSWGRGSDGSFSRMRCSRVAELERVWDIGEQAEDHPALCDSEERVWKWTTRENMDALKFARLLRRL